MLVKPAPGLMVPDPAAKDYLPEEGRDVAGHELYWARRLQEGDVVLVEPPQQDSGSVGNGRIE